MTQERINRLNPLRDALKAIRNSNDELKTAMLDSIVAVPDSREQKDADARVDYWDRERVQATKSFLAEWESIYGFSFYPRTGCESRIPRDEFNYLNQ